MKATPQSHAQLTSIIDSVVESYSHVRNIDNLESSALPNKRKVIKALIHIKNILLALIAGCVPTTYAYTPASSQPVRAKPENCTFEVATTAPTNVSEEIGFLELYNGTAPKNVDDFRKAVAKQVCQVGGDAVIAIANDQGQYTKGTIVRTKP